MVFSSIEGWMVLVVSLGLLGGCGDSSTPSNSRAPTNRDASSKGPAQGSDCTDSVRDVSALTTDAGVIGSLRDTVLGLGGRWTNEAGDELTVLPADTATLHVMSGGEFGQGLRVPCSRLSYAAVSAHVAIRTVDGRLDEAADTELQLTPGAARFGWSIPLGALHGTFKPSEANNLGTIVLNGTYGPILTGAPSNNKVGWNVSGSVDNGFMKFDAGAGHGGFFGSVQVVSVPDFVTRVAPPKRGGRRRRMIGLLPRGLADA